MRNNYKLKKNIKRFFYPKEWTLFFNSLKEKQMPYFKIAINTGARINEIRNITIQDIDFDRKVLTFYVTKVRSRLGEKRPVPRTISLSTEFTQWLQRWIKRNNLKSKDKFGVPTTPGIDKIIKLRLKKLNFKDWEDFSSHNIRKTHGNWLRAIGIDGSEVASRLGHDMNTMIKAYVSPTIFSQEDKILIRKELGDLYER